MARFSAQLWAGTSALAATLFAAIGYPPLLGAAIMAAFAALDHIVNP